jgi:phage shock protein E
MRNWILLLLVSLSASLMSCNKPGPAPEKDAITQALQEPGAMIIDVRTPGEFAGGHAEGAINVPMNELSRIETIQPEKDKQLIVHCAAGVRSAKAVETFKQMGYTKILDAQTPKAVADALGKPLVK